MRRSIFALMFVCMSMPAVADDMDLPFGVVVYDWSGIYAGVQIGYDFGGGSDYTWSGGIASAYDYTHDPDGVLGGVYVGYNHQLTNGLVIGAEADIARGNVRGKTSAPLDPTTFGETKIEWSGSVRGRLGYAVDRFMPYVAGGVAFARLDFTETGVFQGSAKVSLTGWTLGAGAEYAVTDNLIVRAEHRYTDFGEKAFQTIGPASATFAVDHYSHDIRFGISYKF